MNVNSVELCAGAGGQALGLERAGFQHVALVENDRHACATLRLNRPQWTVFEQDLRSFSARGLGKVDLLAAGVPCPPFSHAGKQLGEEDERDLFPDALRIIDECKPDAVLLENVRGLLDVRFTQYRADILSKLQAFGYKCDWKLVIASDHGVPQLRPRSVLVALRPSVASRFFWPVSVLVQPPTVGEVLGDLMCARGWKSAQQWQERACFIAPTLVGGSKKHGGADLGPTRARDRWASIGVDGTSLADFAPDPDFVGLPRLTVRMAARIQGFPDEWQFSGGKTAAYKQVGNAFPPPVAHAIGERIRIALTSVVETRKAG